MAKFEFDRLVTGEEIKGMIEKDLGSGFRVEVKKNRIEIAQDGLRGCFIQWREKEGRTICVGPSAYQPSVGLRTAVMIGPIVLLEIIAVSMGYLVVGILPAIVIGWIAFLIAGSLSRELVRSVAGILERIARKA
jgi:hypothetical protein